MRGPARARDGRSWTMTISTDMDAHDVLAERLVDGVTGAMETTTEVPLEVSV